MPTMSLNCTLIERLTYGAPDDMPKHEILDALARLDHLENLLGDADLDPDASTSLSEQVDVRIDAAIAKQCPDHEAYVEFFRDCFNALNSEYPCAEVTSGHDCRVIIDTISQSDTLRDGVRALADPTDELRALLRSAQALALVRSSHHAVLGALDDALDAARALHDSIKDLDTDNA